MLLSRLEEMGILPSYLAIIACVACLSKSISFPAITIGFFVRLPVLLVASRKSFVDSEDRGVEDLVEVCWVFHEREGTEYFNFKEPDVSHASKGREGCWWRGQLEVDASLGCDRSEICRR